MMTLSDKPATRIEENVWQDWLANLLPSRKQERWQYTDLQHLRKLSTVKVKRDPKPNIPTHPYYQIVIIDGQFDSILSHLPKQVKIKQVPKLPENKQAFYRLNHAAANSHWEFTFPANQTFEKPVVLMSISAQTQAHSQLSIVCEQGVELDLIQYHQCFSKELTLNTERLNIQLAEHAILDYTDFMPSHDELSKISLVNTVLQSHSQLKHTCIDFGAKLSRLELDVHLNGEGAEANLQGLYYAKGNQQINHYLHVAHNASHTSSKQLYKGLANDRSTTAFNGTILVSPGLKDISAEQMNPNILLSPKASMNTKPELLIYSDDVKCAHGATIGDLDHEALFYLASRGIKKELAQLLLLEAFSDEIFDHLKESTFKSIMRHHLIEFESKDV